MLGPSDIGRLVPASLRPVARRHLVRWRHRRLEPADALLVSYPKSGSTWLRFLLADALTSQDADFDSVRDTIPPLDRYRHAPPLISGGGRLIRSHEPLDPYWGRPGQRIVSLVRDGRDVALSYLAHERRYGRFSGDPADFVDRFLAGHVDPYGPWHEHVQAAFDLERSGRARVLQVRYEDLRARTVPELRRILGFLGVDAALQDDDRLARVVARNSKDEMRAKEARSTFLATMQTDGTPFVRPDSRETWADLVPAVHRFRMEQACASALRSGGYELEATRTPAQMPAETKADQRPAIDFVVVGAQRSATTHLNSCLRDHPELFMCPDEVPYFEAPFFSATSQLELEAAVAAADLTQRRGIQRPDYLARPECPGNIRAVAPAARIVALLRDPVERAVSAYHWYVQFGLLPLEPLDTGVSRLLDGWTHPAYPRAGEIIDFGFYGRHLARYIDVFGRDQVLVLLGEDLTKTDTFRSLYRFLGVAEDHEPRIVHSGTNAGVYDMRRLRFLRLRRHLAWSWDDVDVYTYRPRRLRRPLASLVSAAVVAVDRFGLARVFKGGSATLHPEVERRLRAVYADDVADLEALISRDLSSWRHDGRLSPR